MFGKLQDNSCGLSRSVPSRPVSSRPLPSPPIPFRPVPSYPVPSRLIPSHPGPDLTVEVRRLESHHGMVGARGEAVSSSRCRRRVTARRRRATAAAAVQQSFDHGVRGVTVDVATTTTQHLSSGKGGVKYWGRRQRASS